MLGQLASSDHKPMRVLIIVPAFNESANILAVLESLNAQNPHWDVLVVNDGSSDNTAELVAASRKAVLANLPTNLGIGGAVQTGFKYAHRNHYDVAVQFDGDGQHNAQEIPALLRQLELGKADVIVGSRFCEKRPGFKSTLARRMGIKYFEWLNWILISRRITDNTSGFRAYNRRAIAFLAQNYPSDYPEPEAVILLGLNGFTTEEVFVEMRERQKGRSSITGFKALLFMVKVTLAIMMTRLRYPANSNREE